MLTLVDNGQWWCWITMAWTALVALALQITVDPWAKSCNLPWYTERVELSESDTHLGMAFHSQGWCFIASLVEPKEFRMKHGWIHRSASESFIGYDQWWWSLMQMWMIRTFCMILSIIAAIYKLQQASLVLQTLFTINWSYQHWDLVHHCGFFSCL